MISEEAEPLLAALKAKRRALAEAANVPAYIVFNDRTLIEMAETRPQTLDDMRGITGVGEKKLERYGTEFLEVLTGAEPAPVHPARRKLAGRESGTLYDRLAETQARLARGESGLAPYLTCTKTTLARIAEDRPGSREALARVQGMGETRLERFGAAFLEVLAEEA